MGTEIVELGPLNETIHQIDEHIKISELWTLKNIYTDILKGLNKKLAQFIPCIPFFKKGEQIANNRPTATAISPTFVYTSTNADF